MNNIDWNFIQKQEGNNLVGSVPDADNSKSGVTIASGFDLGARSEDDLSGLPDDIIALLKPFLGFKGAKAKEIAKNLKVSKEQADIINKFSHKEAYDNLSAKWEKATGSSFADLPTSKATVIASVAFQYGDLESRTPNFWNQVTSDDWDGAVSNLRNFGDRYSSRRNREADFYESNITEDVTELAQKKILESREIGQKVQKDILARQIEKLPPEPSVEDQLQIPPSPSVEDQLQMPPEPSIEDQIQPVPIEKSDVQEVESRNGIYIDAIKRANEPVGFKFDESTAGPNREQILNNLLEMDYNNAGPVSDFIKTDTSGIAAPFLFLENDSMVWKAAFEEYNPIVAARDAIMDMIDISGYQTDPEYDPFSDPQLRDYKDSMWRFYDSNSADETALRLRNLKEESERQDILNSSKSGGISLIASAITPSSIVPVAPLRYMQSSSALSRFASGAAFSGAAVGIEQGIVQYARETRDFGDTIKVVGLASAFGGSFNAAFGKQMARGKIARDIKREKKLNEMYGEEGFYRSAGASVNPEILAEQGRKMMEMDAPKETGIGVEKLPLNPVLRLLNSDNYISKSIVSEIVDMGGVMQKGIDYGIAAKQSVEKTFTSTYMGPLLNAMNSIEQSYLAYRGIVAKESTILRKGQFGSTYLKDKFGKTNDFISFYEFRVRVAKAMRNEGVDVVQDAATAEVTKAAKVTREVYDFVGDRAFKSNFLQAEARKALNAAIAKGVSPERIAELQKRLENISKHGVFLNNSKSYLNRIYRHDKIYANEAKFRSILNDHGIKLGLRGSKLSQYVDDVFDSILRRKPFMEVDTGIDFEDVLVAGSARSRELDIPDELLEEFLENDIYSLMKYHVTKMGNDIELHNKFGSVDMKSVIDDVISEWDTKIANTSDPIKKAKFEKQKLNDVRDIRGLRDRVRGTYGASKDPHTLMSRSIRGFKSFNVLVGMGGATISSIPDLARPVMVEGMKTVWEKGFKTAFAKNAKIIKEMKLKEANAAGVAGDSILGLRSQALSDVGDMFGSRSTAEGWLSQSTAVMFLINGLNIWNQILKEWTSGITMLRMTDHIMRDFNSLSKASKEKLLKNGIDQEMAKRMQDMIRKHGELVDGEWMPNTDLWEDTLARTTFRTALVQNVDRVIITPGAGDRALWTSTEMGSMLTQFKSYGQAANMRLLVSGLQERDGAFWQGAVLLVLFAGLVNEFKRKQYGITKKESFDEKLLNAIDRSGILGSFMDVNNAIEKISNNGAGMRPAFTDAPQYKMPFGAKAGAVAGPTASNALNIGSIINDVLGGKADQKTLDSARFVTPFGNYPVTDPIFDRIFNQNR